MADKLHRLLNAEDGIHAPHAWVVWSLDEITDLQPSDVGKMARVEGLEGVQLWWLRQLDEGGSTWERVTDGARLSYAYPAAISRTDSSPGEATEAARADHQHDILTAAPTNISNGTTNIEGTSSALARADHRHALASADRTKLDSINPAAGAPADVSKNAPYIGVSSNYARGDHAHSAATGSPVALGASLAEGTATTLARSDHVHTLAAADRTKLDSTVQGPGSTSDNRVARFDGVTGKLVQSSSVEIDDSGNVSGIYALNVSQNINVSGTVDGVSLYELSQAPFVTMGDPDGVMQRNRSLVAGTGISIADGGANGNVTISSTVVATPDVVQGPATPTSTDNAIARWDGSTGRLVQNSLCTISDGGLLTAGALQSNSDVTVAGNVDGVKVSTLPGLIDARAPKNATVIPWSSTSLTLASAHAAAIIHFTGASDAVLTVPSDATENLPVGFSVTVVHNGTAHVSLNDATQGQGLLAAYGADYSIGLEWRCVCTFLKLAANTWLVSGTFASAEAA